MRRGEILDGETERFEERNLVVSAASQPLAILEQELADLGDDMVAGDRALAQWKKNVARLGERRLPPVGVHPRATHGAGSRVAPRLHAAASASHSGAWP